MTTETPQAIAYQQLVAFARERALLLDDQDALQELVHLLARAIWVAVQADLTPDEIREACREGAAQGGKPLETQVIFDPTLDLEYWLRVHAEAEAFWESRSSYSDDDGYSTD